jgi:hypothetical protein
MIGGRGARVATAAPAALVIVALVTRRSGPAVSHTVSVARAIVTSTSTVPW